MPLVPDAAALHRCNESQEGNVIDKAITWKEGLAMQSRQCRDDVDSTHHQCLQLCMYAVSGRDTQCGLRHNPMRTKSF